MSLYEPIAIMVQFSDDLYSVGVLYVARPYCYLIDRIINGDFRSVI